MDGRSVGVHCGETWHARNQPVRKVAVKLPVGRSIHPGSCSCGCLIIQRVIQMQIRVDVFTFSVLFSHKLEFMSSPSACYLWEGRS